MGSTDIREIFNESTFPVPVDKHRIFIFNQIWERLSEPGYWWNAKEKAALVEIIRNAKRPEIFDRKRKSVAELSSQSYEGLIPPLVADTIERIVTEPGDLDRKWAVDVIDKIGEGPYAELIAIVILLMPIDLFTTYLGMDHIPLSSPQHGDALKSYPDNLVDNGAWIRQTQEAVDNLQLVNVSRALSILPYDNTLRRTLVDAMYMEKHSFFDKVWKNKALSRPQLEILATKTSAINKCFYCAAGHSAIFTLTAKKAGQSGDFGFLYGKGKDSNVPHADFLLEIAEKANREPQSLSELRPKIEKVFGQKGMVEIFSVIAIFNGLNRTSDPSGVPLEPVLLAALGKKIEYAGLDSFAGVKRVTRPKGLKRLQVLIAFKLRRILGKGQ
ncbi:hypothetical protein FUAX_35860 [Fulvitalea axinellae]|uniref:Uncharacterized protein n=2 Tax=Fulvitalea axinellae TaxID=1182444 RepID=A0AAU9CXD7_9BACT|nr:hypothetical protein FUAX_35860 [Fulvitalea axinellae]